MNPMEMMMSMGNKNPMAMNLINLYRSGNTKAVEEFGRNVARERGLDFDAEFSKFMSQMGKRL